MNEKSGVSNPVPSNGSVVPDPQVSCKPTRRRFTAEYKLKIVKEADACKKSGEVGALLRREGLYSSVLSKWCKQRDQGALVGLGPRKRGRKAAMANPLARRMAQLEAENRRLKRGLDRAHTILEIQKKASQLLGIPLKGAQLGGNE